MMAITRQEKAVSEVTRVELSFNRMEPSVELIEALDREDIEQARRMTGSQKLRAGGDLFDDACRWTLAAIRADHPGISEADAIAELKRRVALDDK